MRMNSVVFVVVVVVVTVLGFPINFFFLDGVLQIVYSNCPMQFNSIRFLLIVSYRSVFLMLLFLLLFLNSVLWEWKMKVRKMMKWWFSFLFIVNRHLYESWPRLHGTFTIIIIYIWPWNRLYQHRLSRSRSYHMPIQSSWRGTIVRRVGVSGSSHVYEQLLLYIQSLRIRSVNTVWLWFVRTF